MSAVLNDEQKKVLITPLVNDNPIIYRFGFVRPWRLLHKCQHR